MTPNKECKKHKEFLIHELIEIKTHIFRFLKNPIVEIKNLPNWTWPKIIIFLAIFSSICGLLSGIVEKNKFAILSGFLLNPIISISLVGVSTLFFGIFFKIFADQALPWRKLFTLIAFSNLPNFIFSIAANYVSPIILIGLGFTSLLLIKGLIENFHLERKLVLRVIAGLYVLFFITWFFSEIKEQKFNKISKEEISAPEVHLGK